MNKKILYKNQLSSFWKQFMLLVFTIICLFPVYYMFITAFKSHSEYLINKFGIPLHPTLINFEKVFRGKKFLIWFINSIILTGFSVIVSVIVSSFAAYAFAKMDFKGKNAIFNLILTLMVVPPVVMIIPLFKIMVKMKMVNTYQSVILIYSGLTLPFSIYMLTNFFKTIPSGIIDSAKIDGCNSLKILSKIIIPLSAPALITIVLVNALWVWNELLIAVIFLQKDNMKTLMVGLTIFKSRYNLDIPVTMAGLTLATIPMLALYFSGQKYFIKGLVAGAIK